MKFANQTHNYFFKVTVAVVVFLFVGIFPAQQAQAAENELWASGYNGWATLGLGDHVNRSSSTQVAPGTTWTSIEPSMLSTYAIKTDGTLWVWGSNKWSTGGSFYSSLGLGYYSDDITIPTQVAPGTTWTSVATLISAPGSTVAIKTDGTLWAWGYNPGGQLGLGYASNSVATPTQIGSASNWRSVSAGYYHFMGIKTDGTLWAWGSGYAPELGLGPYDRYTPASYFYSPLQVGTATNWRSVQSAYHSTVALKTDGTLWAWGANGFGQLGLGCYSGQTGCPDVNVPTQVGTGTNWASVSTKSEFVAAIKTDGTLWTWGTNVYGELGNGTGYNYYGALSPTQVGTDTNWASASGSDWPQNSVTAIKTDGTMWAWGSNAAGQLGLGYAGSNVFTPTQVGTRTDWGSASRGYQTAMAMTAVSCIATTVSNCDLPGPTTSGSSVNGSCSSGYVGSCRYSCSNGAWSMSSNSCAVPVTCTTPWGSTVADGVSVQAFSVASVVTPTACPASQTRTCTNGALSGTYQNVNCIVLIPTIDTFVAVPTRVRSGGSVALSWSTTSAISCAVTRNGVAWKSGTSGTNIPDTISTQTIYTIACLTGGAPMTKSITVNVVPTFYEF